MVWIEFFFLYTYIMRGNFCIWEHHRGEKIKKINSKAILSTCSEAQYNEQIQSGLVCSTFTKNI